jgi:NADH dehydrogenase FAD-containing subunit
VFPIYLVSYSALPDKQQVIFPIKENFFSKYSASQFRFIHATATALDTTAKTVTLNTSETIVYNYLVIATGSHTAAVKSGIPVKQPINDTLVNSIQSAQTRIANASTIVISGSGAVAVEMAGEIAEGYPDKKVTIVSGSSRLLPVLGEKASGIALKRLKKLGVEVLLGVRVLGKSEGGKEGSVKIDGGKVIEADLYIPAIGVIPNSSFIPPALLDASGYLITTPEQKVSSPDISDVYGIGDITTNPSKMAVTITQQIAVTVANLKHDIEKTGKRKAFQTETTTLVIPIGEKGGVAEMGDLGGLVLWSWVVSLVKGGFFIRVPFLISGLKKQ